MGNTKTIKARYLNNKLSLDDVPKEEHKRIRELWNTLREDYTDWVADVRMKDFGAGKPMVELLPWKGMSTWWLNPLVEKDNENNNGWFNRLMVLYLFRTFSGRISFETDDKLLFKSIVKNFSNVSRIFKPSGPFSVKQYLMLRWSPLLKVARFVSKLFIVRYLLLIGFRRLQISRYASLKSSIWYITFFPANWIKAKNEYWCDRHFCDAPLKDSEYGQLARYIVYVIRYAKDKNIGIFKLWNELRNLEKKTGREIAFPEAHLRLQDIGESFLSTFREWMRFKSWRRLPYFKELFRLRDMDVADILLDEWESGYWGVLQYNKLHGLAMARFLQDVKHEHTVVTYGEIFVQNRSVYHLSKLYSPHTKFVAVQHAMNVKNKMCTYHRKTEFERDATIDHIIFSPTPNKFLTQGSQYSEIVTEFFDPYNVSIIGSLKYDHYTSILRNKEEIKRHCNEKLNLDNSKILLLAPSVNDHQEIIDIFSCWEEKDDWEVMLSPHPATDVNTIKAYQEKLYPDLEINYETNFRTYELMTVSSLVITGYSTTAIEACFFGVRSVRFLNLGTFPLFDYEASIPVFHDGYSFMKWFENQEWENTAENKKETRERNELISKYFYKIDGKTSDRLWKFLNTDSDLPHNIK